MIAQIALRLRCLLFCGRRCSPSLVSFRRPALPATGATWVRLDTILSGPLAEAVEQQLINLRFIP